MAVALPLPLRRHFTYAVPASMPRPRPGTRVRVPFGERVLTGIVLAEDPAPAPDSLREIIDVLDDEPVCPPDLLATAGKVADRFFASTGEVLKSALPARLPASGAVRYRITGKGALAAAAVAGRAGDSRRARRRRAGARPRSARRGARAARGVRSLEDRGWIGDGSVPSNAGEAARDGLRARARARRRGRSARSAASRKGRDVVALARGARETGVPRGDPRPRPGRERPCFGASSRRGCCGPSSRSAPRAGASRRGPRGRFEPTSAQAGRDRRDRRSDPEPGVLPGSSRGRHGQRKDRGLPARDPRRPRRRARGDLARAGDRADARLRPRAHAPVPGARGGPALGALRARARARRGTACDRGRRAP